MNSTDKVRTVMRWIFAIWISVLSIFVGIASFQVYRTAEDEEAAKRFDSIKVPSSPKPLLLEQEPILKLDDQVKIWQQKIAAYEKQVSAYEKEVAAYEKQITAHKTHMELAAKADTLARYKAVVTDTLVVYLGGGFFTTFLAWLFANLAAGATERFTELRQQNMAAVNAERFAALGQPQPAPVASVVNQPLKSIKLL